MPVFVPVTYNYARVHTCVKGSVNLNAEQSGLGGPEQHIVNVWEYDSTAD